MEKPTGVYEEIIHSNDYRENYKSPVLDSHSFIYNRNRRKESLNGMWRFEADPYDVCLRGKWFLEQTKDADGFFNTYNFSFDHWDYMEVPATWNTERERYYLYEGAGVYTRTFIYRRKGAERVFFKFGAAGYEAKIFLNKAFLGSHKGGSTPFFVEVTQHLQEDNRILVVVDNKRTPERLPAENFDWFNYGGLYRGVEILRLPPVFIKQFQIALMPDGSFSNIRVFLRLSDRVSGKARVSIPELGIEKNVEIAQGTGEIVFTAMPELWSPESPKLYRVEAAFGEDSVSDMVGFCELRTQGKDILLNGKKIYLKGVSKHEDSVAYGRTQTEEEMLTDLREAKALNCNMIRLSHYPHTERFIELADEIGMLLWEEIPAYWIIAFSCEETCEDAENQLAEVILRDYNRASVMAWCICNENADTDSRLAFALRMKAKAKELDDTRLVTAACLFDHANHRIADRLSKHLDIISVNEYYGWYQNDLEKLPKFLGTVRDYMDRPAVISEFGADGTPFHRGFSDEKGTLDCQTYIYERQIAQFEKADYLNGVIAWVLHDFRTPRRHHFSMRQSMELRHYNTKGLLTADRKERKPAFYILRDFYAKK